MLAKLTFSPFLFFFLLGLLFSLTDDFEKYGGKGRGKFEERRLPKFRRMQALEYFGRVGLILFCLQPLFSRSMLAKQKRKHNYTRP